MLWRSSTAFGVETEQFGSETEIDGMMLESRAEAATADVGDRSRVFCRSLGWL